MTNQMEFSKWKFYVFMVDNIAMLTTYGLFEEEAKINLYQIVEQNKELKEGLTAEKVDLLFTVDSPFDLSKVSDEQKQKLCVLITHTIVANDACNMRLRQTLTEGESTTH